MDPATLQRQRANFLAARRQGVAPGSRGGGRMQQAAPSPGLGAGFSPQQMMGIMGGANDMRGKGQPSEMRRPRRRDRKGRGRGQAAQMEQIGFRPQPMPMPGFGGKEDGGGGFDPAELYRGPARGGGGNIFRGGGRPTARPAVGTVRPGMGGGGFQQRPDFGAMSAFLR